MRLARPVWLLLGLSACAAPRPTELVNVTYTPSVETEHYATWDFELESCQGFRDPRIDDEDVRRLLLEAIALELEARGFRRLEGGPVDFRVFYELWVDDAGGEEAVEERARGRILVRDVATGRLVWRGERKARIRRASNATERAEALRAFAAELLQYTTKLDDLRDPPEPAGPGDSRAQPEREPPAAHP